MYRLIFLIIVFGLFPKSEVFSQQDVPEKFLEVRGNAELEMEPLPRATVNLYDGTEKVKSIQTAVDGSFSLRLEINKQYTIEVEKDGLVSKRIFFNTQLPDEEKGSWMNEFSIGLLRKCEGMDYSVLKEPVDRVSFDAKKREYISDKDYVSRNRPRLESLMMKNDNCLLEKFESLVKKGDQMGTQKNYQEAINTYKEALKIYPNEEYPAKKITEINSLIGKQQFSAEAYKKIVSDADALFSQGKINEALQKYNQASVLNPQEEYPKQKASEIESTLAKQKAEKQAQQNIDDRFNQAMAKASVAYTKKDYATAKQFYQEALTIKPSELLAKSRVEEIEKIQTAKAAENDAKAAEASKKAAIEKEYNELVAQADALFKSKQYKESKELYAKALTIKPMESYPAQRVKTIENAVASEQASIQKEKEDGYKKAMAAGDLALSQNQFETAKESFQKALTIKPDDLQAKTRLAEVGKLNDEYAKRKSTEEQYANLMQSGQASLASKDLQAAKESFSKALLLKPGDKDALTKITAIDNALAAEQAAVLKTKTSNYNNAITEGNRALSQNQFVLAKESFQKALTIKPDDQLAKSKIIETDKLAEEFSKQKSINEQYAKIIQTADEQLKLKELDNAKKSYSQALGLKPGDSYAQSKITAIDNTIASEQALKLKTIEDNYKAAIGAANTAIAQKSYKQARDFLKNALQLKPGDQYATNRASEVENLIALDEKRIEKENQLTKQYKGIIAEADKYFDQKDYSNARVKYNSALQIKPSDSYANQKLSTIDNIIAAENLKKQKETEESFKSAMILGNNALLSNEYIKAKESFQKALTIKPDDNSAKQKLKDVDLLISQEQEKKAAEQARKKKYDDLIKTADLSFTQQNYSSAKAFYEQALVIIPGDAYARQKIEESSKAIDEKQKALEAEKAKESAYNLALVNGDKFFKAKDYSQSKIEYTRASAIKPNETFPKAKIAEIENLISAQQKELAEAKAKSDAYTTAIKMGNDLFEKKDWIKAKEAYNEALKNRPGDILASDQIKKTDYFLAETEKARKAEQERKAAYDLCIKDGDNLFNEGKYLISKESYKKALSFDPNSLYAKQRIERIDEINKALSKPAVNVNTNTPVTASKVTAAIPLKDINFKTESERQKYLDQLKEKYPSGITLEKYKEQYREIYRYIIIRENEAQEFRHLKFTTYNGEQFSVNGKPITQQYFLSQIKLRAGESFNEIDMN